MLPVARGSKRQTARPAERGVEDRRARLDRGEGVGEARVARVVEVAADRDAGRRRAGDERRGPADGRHPDADGVGQDDLVRPGRGDALGEADHVGGLAERVAATGPDGIRPGRHRRRRSGAYAGPPRSSPARRRPASRSAAASTTRATRAWPRPRRDQGGLDGPRRLARRDRRLPVRPRATGNSRNQGPRLPPARHGPQDRDRPRRAHRALPSVGSQAARQGAPGRLGGAGAFVPSRGAEGTAWATPARAHAGLGRRWGAGRPGRRSSSSTSSTASPTRSWRRCSQLAERGVAATAELLAAARAGGAPVGLHDRRLRRGQRALRAAFIAKVPTLRTLAPGPAGPGSTPGSNRAAGGAGAAQAVRLGLLRHPAGRDLRRPRDGRPSW